MSSLRPKQKSFSNEFSSKVLFNSSHSKPWKKDENNFWYFLLFFYTYYLNVERLEFILTKNCGLTWLKVILSQFCLQLQWKTIRYGYDISTRTKYFADLLIRLWDDCIMSKKSKRIFKKLLVILVFFIS